MLTLSALLGGILVGVVGLTVAFYFFARLCRAGTVTWGRIIGAAAATFPIYIAAYFFLRVTAKPNTGVSPFTKSLAANLEPIVVLAVMAVIAKVMLKAPWWRPTLALVLTWGAAGLPAQYLYTRFVGTTYVASSNSMAPTLLAWHMIEQCPQCQGKLMVPAQPPGKGNSSERADIGICERCREASPNPKVSKTIWPPETFFVLKFLRPTRWDPVLYIRPDSPTEAPVIGVARLVGLPGEALEIREQALWINGELAKLPTEIAGMQYHAKEDHRQPDGIDRWQTRDSEYVLLGDFTEFSSDSRFFGSVPARNILGVVSARRGAGERTAIWR